MAEIVIHVRDDNGVEISVSKSSRLGFKMIEMENLFAQAIEEMCIRMGVGVKITQDGKPHPGLSESPTPNGQ